VSTVTEWQEKKGYGKQGNTNTFNTKGLQ